MEVARRTFVEDVHYEGPLNVYGYSKYLFDQVLRSRMHTLTAPVVGLRYFNVYGPPVSSTKDAWLALLSISTSNLKKEGHVRAFRRMPRLR